MMKISLSYHIRRAGVVAMGFVLWLIAGGGANSAMAAQLPIHCESDTAEIKTIVAAIDPQLPAGRRIAMAAESLKGRGADTSLYADSAATLAINVDEFTPMTFVNTALALGKISGQSGAGWRAYAETISDLSCRQGNDTGFPSLMWHVSDWAGDNIYRGNLKELTDRYQGARSTTVSLDYLTRHRDEFASLANQEVYDNVRMTEMGFRSHKIPYLPRQAAGQKEVEEDLRDGDVIALFSDRDGGDRYAIGIIAMRPDGPHLIHFDAKEGKVVEEDEPLKRYLNKVAKYIKGFRWFRLN